MARWISWAEVGWQMRSLERWSRPTRYFSGGATQTVEMAMGLGMKENSVLRGPRKTWRTGM